MKICTTCKRTWEDEFRLCPIDGSSLQAAASNIDSNIGKAAGQCRIVEKVADGDLGPIYKAEEPTRGLVALQVIPQSRITSSIILEALGDAVKLAAKVNHPRLIRIYGMEPAPDGASAVMMEYVDGTTLENYRRGRPGMEVTEVCSLVRQAAEGLVAAHRGSLMHGALHPSRILVCRDGTVKLGGFHRSGLREGVDAFTLTQENLPYIAPEIIGIVRELAVADYRADIYSLGVILYELLTGRLPYDAKNLQELSTLMETAPPLPPNFTNAQISPLLSRVVLRAIAKHPAERHGSAEEFLRELDAARQPSREPQRPVAAEPPPYSPPYPPSSSSSIFGPSAQSGQDSGIFAPSSRRQESIDNILPEASQARAGAEDGSFFGWFKTRIDRAPGHGRSSESRKPAPMAWDDSTSSGAAPRRQSEEEFTEKTVVVSGSGRGKAKRRSFSDTLFRSEERDLDATGTGMLPRRRINTKVWILAIAGIFLIAGIITAVYFIFFSTPKGRLVVSTNPPGAQVFICMEPCKEGGFHPLLESDLKTGSYLIRVQMDGYETKEDRIAVNEKDDLRPFYDLNAKTPPPPPLPPPLPADNIPVPTPVSQPLPPQGTTNKLALATPFYKALRDRTFFPDAWDILQRWQQSEAGSPSPALEEAVQQFCGALVQVSQEKLSLKDFAGTRQLLEHMRTRMPGQPCVATVQSNYDKAVSNDKQSLKIGAQSAMDRQSYVTPESDNALKYVRQILIVDPNDAEAQRMDNDIFNRAWEQAKSAASKRQHQEALDIAGQLKAKYLSPPIGLAQLNEFIQKQTQKAEQYQALKPSLSIQVKHGHPRNIAFWRTRECSGTLKIDGFSIEFKSATEPEHSFKISYDGLKDTKISGDTLSITHPEIRPEAKIEFQEIDKRSNPNLAQVYKKMLEYRDRYMEYVR